MSRSNQIRLPVEDLPKRWYNIVPDLPEPLPPPKDPEEGESRLAMLEKVMIRTCLEQDSSDERWIDIPEEVRTLYIQAGRPRPLIRARRLERVLHLPEDGIRLYYKREDLSPTGSHKVNTALPQCYYAKKEGFEGVSTETGAGQWGSAMAYASALNQLRCHIFWVRAAYDWKPGRRVMMKLYGAEVYPSPSPLTETGRSILKRDPNHPGSLGIAVSEGLEYVSTKEGYAYSLGSVMNHVLMHQTIIGLETMKQFEMVDDEPDVLIGCFGGGSNFGGFSLPFMREVLAGKRECSFLASQSEVAPNIAKGEYRYDFADHAGKTPLLKMYTIGHDAEMQPIRGEGLRYSGAAPIMSLLRHLGYLDAKTYPADETAIFGAARLFAQTEGFIPAPESAYAIRAMIDEAVRYKELGEEKTLACNISGHGFLDMEGYREALNL